MKLLRFFKSRPRWIDLKKEPNNVPEDGKLVIGVMLYTNLINDDKKYIFDFFCYNHKRKKWCVKFFKKNMEIQEWSEYVSPGPLYWIDIQPPNYEHSFDNGLFCDTDIFRIHNELEKD